MENTRNLVSEMLSVSVADLTPAQRVVFARRVFGLLHDVRHRTDQVHSAASTVLEGGEWNMENLEVALDRLEQIKASAQVKVIRAALRTGGVIHREDVYRIGKYEQKRSLRGFTRPINRVVHEMTDDGLLSRDVEPLLTPTFDTGVAFRFQLPEIFRDQPGQISA